MDQKIKLLKINGLYSSSLGLALIFSILVLIPVSLCAKPITKCRDATTGQYVSHKFAKKYPASVVCEKK